MIRLGLTPPPSRFEDGSPELRGCLRSNGLDHLACDIWELRVPRMSQAAPRPLPEHNPTTEV
eukprot:8367697-Pyramimonas_sp.AAC.1